MESNHRNQYSIQAMRALARKRLPRMIFDFIDGGAEDEITHRRNVSSFDDITFAPKVLCRTPDLDCSTTVLGQTLKLPIMVAPTGLSGMVWPQGESAVARACKQAGTIMTVSHATTVDMQTLCQNDNYPMWYQTLIYKDRGLTREFADRAKQSGYHALVLTVDLQALGQRERDIRNHFTVPPKITLRNTLDALSAPRWLFDYLTQPAITMTGYARNGMTDLGTLAKHMGDIFDADVGWDDVQWLREYWQGPLILKGILHPQDARQAANLGVDAIVVSNHGGRQLDGAPAPITVLPEIAHAVADDIEIYMCSGIRRGAHVVKALSLGAKAVFIGRPHLWGLAVNGEAGVRKVLELLHQEMQRTMALGGWNRISDIGEDATRHLQIDSRTRSN